MTQSYLHISRLKSFSCLWQKLRLPNHLGLHFGMHLYTWSHLWRSKSKTYLSMLWAGLFYHSAHTVHSPHLAPPLLGPFSCFSLIILVFFVQRTTHKKRSTDGKRPYFEQHLDVPTTFVQACFVRLSVMLQRMMDTLTLNISNSRDCLQSILSS